MQRRKWDAKTKAMIVLEGLKGKPVAELCTEHQISQAQYYQWRDHFLAHASKAFEVHEQSQREARLDRPLEAPLGLQRQGQGGATPNAYGTSHRLGEGP